MHWHVRSYLITYLLTCFLLSLLTYSTLIPYIKRYCQALTRKFSQTTLRKLLIFCQGKFLTMIFVKNWTTFSDRSDHGALNFTFSFMFHTRININFKKCIATILIFSHFTSMYMPNILEKAPAQVLNQLRYWVLLPK